MVDDDKATEVLEDLVEQTEGAGYRDRLGHPLENNVAYRDAVRLVEGDPPADRDRHAPPADARRH